MATALEIITDAYREGNIIPIGMEPNAAQQTEALRRLNAVISSALGFEIGEGLIDWMVGQTNAAEGIISSGEARWTRPPQNVRLLLNAQSPQTLILPARVDDGARLMALDMLGTLATYPVTLKGNGRRIEGQDEIVLNVDGTSTTWFYRADLGDWKKLSQLLIADDMPFPSEFDDSFITLLAMRLNPRMGRAMDPQTRDWLASRMNLLQARYRQKPIIPADYGAVAMTHNGYGDGYGPDEGYRHPYGWMS